MNNDILDLAEMLMEELEKAGYSTVNNAGFKSISIYRFNDSIVVDNCVAIPPIYIERSFDKEVN